MFRTLKKYFIPHPGNNHVPHILRIEAVLVMLACAFLAEALFLAHVFVVSTKTGLLAEIIANVLVDETNNARIAVDLPPIAPNPFLERAAAMKAEDMATNGYFAHTSPEGIMPWHWFDAAGYEYVRAGENLAVNFVDSEDVVRAWLASPKHRENIENSYYTEIGIATARGTYKGKDTVFIVQLFGLPAARMEASKLVAVNSPAVAVGVNEKPSVLPQEPGPVASATLQTVAGAETPQDSARVVADAAAVQDGIPAQQMSETKRYSKFLERLVSSPKAVTQIFYLALATLVILAFVFVFFLRAPVPHPYILKHSVAFLVIIGTVILLNHYATVVSASVL